MASISFLKKSMIPKMLGVNLLANLNYLLFPIPLCAFVCAYNIPSAEISFINSLY